MAVTARRVELGERGRARPWLWPYGLLGGVLLLAMGPVWTTAEEVIGGDILLQHYPLQVLWRDLLAAGELPFWNPYTLGGQPAYANPLAGYAYPLHWPLLALPASSALNWAVTVHVVLAGMGAAFCAGRLGAAREGQFLSGIAYALGSALSQRLWAGHLNWIEASAWLPTATALAVGIGRPRTVAYLGLVVGLILLSGRPEAFLFCLWWLPGWAAIAARGQGWRGVGAAVLRVWSGVGLGLALAAVQVAPTAEVLAVSNRQAGVSWAFLTDGSLPPWHLVSLLWPTILGEPRSASYWPGADWEWHERVFFLGLVPLAAAARAGGRWRWACLGLGGAALGLAFGRYVPWYGWVQAAVPGYATFRVPSKHLVLAALALALAAGLGLPRLRGRRVALGLLAAGTLLGSVPLHVGLWLPRVAALLAGADGPRVPAPEAISGAAANGALAAALVLALAGALALLPSPWATRGHLVLAVLELGLAFQPYRANLLNPRPLVEQLAPLRAYSRAAVTGEGGYLAAQFGPLVRVTQPGGYDPLVSHAYSTLLLGASRPEYVVFRVSRADDPVLALLGVQAVFEPGRPPAPPQEPPRPPAWVARCAWPGGSLEVRQPDFPRQACVARTLAVGRQTPAPAGPARVLAEGAGRLVAEAEGPGWLVTTLPWYPGWSARLDGAPAAVEIVDGALVGVALPGGRHRVELWYVPAGLVEGGLVSTLAGLGLAGWVVWSAARARGCRAHSPFAPTLAG